MIPHFAAKGKTSGYDCVRKCLSPQLMCRLHSCGTGECSVRVWFNNDRGNCKKSLVFYVEKNILTAPGGGGGWSGSAVGESGAAGREPQAGRGGRDGALSRSDRLSRARFQAERADVTRQWYQRERTGGDTACDPETPKVQLFTWGKNFCHCRDGKSLARWWVFSGDKWPRRWRRWWPRPCESPSGELMRVRGDSVDLGGGTLTLCSAYARFIDFRI